MSILMPGAHLRKELSKLPREPVCSAVSSRVRGSCGEKIVVINAGFVNESLGIAHSLLHALSQARDKLHCSFTGMDGQDVYNDIRRMIVEIPPCKKPRSYRFKVQYFNFSDEGVEEGVGEGEILYLLPRHPQTRSLRTTQEVGRCNR